MKLAVKQLVGLSIPMITSQGLSVFTSFLCMLMLAHLGHDVLAASALIFSIQTTLSAIATSSVMGVGYLVGHAKGAKNFPKIGLYLQHGWFLALVMALMMFVLTSFIGPILLASHQSPVLVHIVSSFFNIYRFTLFGIMLSVATAQVFYGTGHAKFVLLTGVLSAAVLLGVAVSLIHGLFGFPRLGVEGLAIATVFQTFTQFLALLGLILCKKSFQSYEIFNWRFFKAWAVLKEIFQMGWPIFVQMTGELLSFSMGAVMVGWLGTDALAAYQVVIQCWFVLVIAIFALSYSTGILIGQARGAEDWVQLKKLGRVSWLATLGVVVIVAIVFLVFPKELANLYLSPTGLHYEATLKLVIPLFAVTALNQFWDGFRNVLTGALRGLKDARFPMYLSLILIWLVGMPLSYLFGFIFKGGLIGLAMGSTLGMFLAVLILAYRWKGHMNIKR